MQDVKTYILPQEMRSELKEPIGFLADEKQMIDFIKQSSQVVSVGDQVTYTLLSHDINPWICIIDYQIKRQQYNSSIKKTLKSYGDRKVQVKNPAGMITEALFIEIKNAYQKLHSSEHLRIDVDGEEDLAALPAILMAPENVTIIYGMPDKGVVVVPSSDKYKQKVKEILAKM